MKVFYELYVHLMVWLGAAPPEGYEYLLPVEERMKMVSTEYSSTTSVASTQENFPALAATGELNGKEYIAEEDLPDWIRDAARES